MRSNYNYKKTKHHPIIGLLGLLVCTLSLQAQTIGKFSVGSGGAIATTSGIQILFTVGEVAIREVNAPTFQLSEGFINPNTSATLDIDAFELSDFKMFPNPVSDVLFLESNIPIDQVDIYDSLGKQIMTQNHTNANAIDVNALHTGTYFIKIYSEDSIIHRKFIKK